MESITLSDGREIPVISFAIATSGHMFIRVAMNMGEAFQAFSSGTDRIIYNQGDGERIMISGFTSLEQAAVPTTTKSEPKDYRYESNYG